MLTVSYPLYILELITDEVQLGKQVTELGVGQNQENSRATAAE